MAVQLSLFAIAGGRLRTRQLNSWKVEKFFGRFIRGCSRPAPEGWTTTAYIYARLDTAYIIMASARSLKCAHGRTHPKSTAFVPLSPLYCIYCGRGVLRVQVATAHFSVTVRKREAPSADNVCKVAGRPRIYKESAVE